MNMKKILISAFIVVVFAVILWMQRGGSPEATPSVSASPSVSVSPSVSPTATASGTATKTPTPVASAVKTFTVTASNFSFTPNQMTVNKGDTVKIIFKNANGQHDWKLDEFNALTNIISAGQEQTIQFVATKTGTFEYYCSVGTHRQMGMKGTLTVK